MRFSLLRSLVWAFFMAAAMIFVAEYSPDLLSKATIMFLLLLLGKTVELRIRR